MQASTKVTIFISFKEKNIQNLFIEFKAVPGKAQDETNFPKLTEYA